MQNAEVSAEQMRQATVLEFTLLPGQNNPTLNHFRNCLGFTTTGDPRVSCGKFER